VLKWLLTLLIALLVLGALTPWLRRLGFGRMPGDITIERGRQTVFVPGWLHNHAVAARQLDFLDAQIKNGQAPCLSIG